MNRKKLSKELKAMAKELEPSDAFLRRGSWATDKIYLALCAPSSEFSVDRMIVAGSIGKKTALDDSTDFDLVVFLNHVEPKFSRELLEKMEKSIRHLPGYRKVKITQFSVQFQMKIEGHLFDFDLLPASNFLSKLCLEGIDGG
jgi:tRNA nucleotidyltransferase (CCA-adding enzyme)